jgi:hypothetical protein
MQYIRKHKEDEWSDKEVALLKKHFPVKDTEEVSKIIGRSVRAIRSKAFSLSLEKSNRYWTKEQEKLILKKYYKLGADELSRKIGKTKWAVINKFRELTGKRR